MARLNLDFAWDSPITLSAVGAYYVRSDSVVLGTLSPRNERREGNSPNTSAAGTTPSDPSVSLHALTAKLSRNSFFSLGRLIRSFRNVRLTGSWHRSPILSAL